MTPYLLVKVICLLVAELVWKATKSVIYIAVDTNLLLKCFAHSS